MLDKEKTNKYLAEAKLQGYTPEMMARSAAFAHRNLLHYEDMRVSLDEATDFLCFCAQTPDIPAESLKWLSIQVEGLRDFVEMYFPEKE